MKNTIMCCISCILPCGSFDVIRIVHSNGHVEELSGAVKASDIMKAHPKHILKKPSTSSSAVDAAGDPTSAAGAATRIVIVPPDANLQRGKIYFLMPLPPSAAPAPEKSRPSVSSSSSSTATTTTKTRNKKRKEKREKNVGESRVGDLIVSTDRYLNDILSEKFSRRQDRRRRRVAVWRPHLDSISESITD